MSSAQLQSVRTGASAFPSGAYTYRLVLSFCLFILVCLSSWRHHSPVGVFVLALVSWLFCADVLHRAARRDLAAFRMSFALFAGLSCTAALIYSAVNTFALVPLWGPLPFLYVQCTGVITLSLWLLRRQALRREQTKVFIKKLDDFLPKSARLCVGRAFRKVFADELQTGDLVFVKPGERIPCDGILRKGKSAVDESLITGNMLPSAKAEGSVLYAGTLNKSDEIYVEVTGLVHSSVIAGILNTIKTSERMRAETVCASDRYCALFLPLTVAAAAGAYAWCLSSGSPADWLACSGVFLFVLGMGFPAAFVFVEAFAVLFAKLGARRKGIVLQNIGALNELVQADTVFFDKTGTLTYGVLRVSAVHPVLPTKKRALLQAVVTAEQWVDGPFAQAVNDYAEEHRIRPGKLLCFDVLPGMGIRARSERNQIVCGREKWFADMGIQTDSIQIASASEAVICVAKNGEYLGYLTLSDQLRPCAKEMVRFLNNRKKELILISGDNESSVSSIARSAGIEQMNFNVLPQTKAEIVSNLRAMGKKVVMVGDGFNDITALLRADAGIVFSSGRNVYNNWVDILIKRKDLLSITDLFKINTKLKAAVFVNVLLAFLLNGAALAWLFFKTPAWYAAPACVCGAVLAVFLNSARLLK